MGMNIFAASFLLPARANSPDVSFQALRSHLLGRAARYSGTFFWIFAGSDSPRNFQQIQKYVWIFARIIFYRSSNFGVRDFLCLAH